MGRSKRSPEGEHCRCGLPHRTSNVASYRTHLGSYRYHRCDCGTEWTERVPHVDPSVPVSGDEVLEVHLLMAGFEGGLTELIDISEA